MGSSAWIHAALAEFPEVVQVDDNRGLSFKQSRIELQFETRPRAVFDRRRRSMANVCSCIWQLCCRLWSLWRLQTGGLTYWAVSATSDFLNSECLRQHSIY